jgi:4-methylaminobutanoate oxidase (formaldehyde-forming)
VVIAAAGAWSNTLLAPLGAFVPTAPVRSHYWITDRDSLFPDRHPVAFLPDARAYTRPELGALLFGLRDRTSVCADPTALPRDVSGFAFDEDPDGGRALEEGFSDLVRFIPALGRAGIAHYVCGLSDYTPDGLPVVGPLEGAEGLIAVAGCGAGIAISGGVGLAAAELAAGGEPSLDISAFDPGRFGAVDPFDPAFRRRCAAARSRKGQDRELTDS